MQAEASMPRFIGGHCAASSRPPFRHHWSATRAPRWDLHKVKMPPVLWTPFRYGLYPVQWVSVTRLPIITVQGVTWISATSGYTVVSSTIRGHRSLVPECSRRTLFRIVVGCRRKRTFLTYLQSLCLAQVTLPPVESKRSCQRPAFYSQVNAAYIVGFDCLNPSKA